MHSKTQHCYQAPEWIQSQPWPFGDLWRQMTTMTFPFHTTAFILSTPGVEPIQIARVLLTTTTRRSSPTRKYVYRVLKVSEKNENCQKGKKQTPWNTTYKIKLCLIISKWTFSVFLNCTSLRTNSENKKKYRVRTNPLWKILIEIYHTEIFFISIWYNSFQIKKWNHVYFDRGACSRVNYGTLHDTPHEEDRGSSPV